MLPLLECLTLLCLAPGILNQPSPDCLTPQGMQSGAIEDAHLVVSSQADGKSKEKARYGCCQDECRAAWCPQDNDTSPYYEVHFKTPTSVSALAFQHPTSANQACNFYAEDFMQTFRLLFKPVIGTGELVEFNQNISAIQNESLTYAVQFEPSFVTQTIRIEPQDYQNNACFKFEVYGCEPSVLCPRDFCKNNGLCMGTNLCECTQGYFGKTCELQEVDIKSTVYNLLFTKIEEHILHTTEFSMKLSGSVHLEEVSGQKIMILGEGGAGQVITTGQSDLCLKDIDQCHAGFSYSLNLNIEKIQSEKKRIIFLSNGNDFNTEKGIWLFYEHNVFTCYAGTSEEFWSVQVSHALTVGAWYKLAVSWNRALGLQLLLNNQVIGSKVQSMRRHTDSYTSEPLTIGSTSNHGVTYRVFLLQLAPLVASEVLRANIAEITPPSLPTGENITTPPPQPLPTTVQSASAATNDVTPAVTRDVSLTTDVTQGCESALGMRGGEITEDDIMVSSSSPGHGKQKLRHDCCTGEELGGWCADSTDKDPWVEIRFPMPKVISKVVFQLPACPDNLPRSYVTAVDVLYHNLLSPSNHLELYAEHVQAVTNGSSNTVALRPEIVTDRVRMSINSSVGQPCMRFELIGCEQKVSREKQATSSATTETAAPTPEPSICESSMTDISFMSINGTELLTSLSTMAVHGAATIEASPDGTLLILDGQGQYIDMQKTGIACLDDITTCGTRFNFRLTFKFITIDIDKNYILSSGGNINNSSGISLYYWHDTLNFWVKYGKEVYMSIYQANLSSDTWYTLDASWDKDSGNTSIYLNGEAIKAKQRRHYPAPEPTEKHSLLLGKSPEGEHTSRMKLLLVRLWTDTYTRLTDQNCTRELQLPIVAATVSTPPTTTTTQETIKSINLAFTSIRGKTLVTSSFNLTVSGSPQLIQDRNITFLQLNGTNQGLEIPQNSLPCLTSTINCHSGFTFQIGIMIQFIKAQEKTILVSNGKNSSSTMSLYYESKHLHLIVFRGKEKWVVTVPYTIHTNKLNIYQISWSMTEGLQLYENNVLLGIEKNPISVSTSHTSTSNIHVGMTSATLLITSIQTWTASRVTLGQRGILEHPNIPPTSETNSTGQTEVTNKLTHGPQSTPASTKMPSISHHPVHHEFRFSQIIGDIIVTPEFNITKHGHITLNIRGKETFLLITSTSQWLEIKANKLGCISNPTTCSDGFTIDITATLQNMTSSGRIYLLKSDENASAFFLYHERNVLYGQVIVDGRRFNISTTFVIQDGHRHAYELMWSQGRGLQLLVDNKLMVETTISSTVSNWQATVTNIRFGEVETFSSILFEINEIQIWNRRRDFSMVTTHVSTLPTTTTTQETIKSINLAFTTIRGKTLVTSSFNLTVSGSPQLIQDRNITFLQLNGTNQGLEIPQNSLPCLKGTIKCHSGFTFQIGIMIQFIKAQEKTILVSNGKNSSSTMSLYYESKHLHLIVFRGKEKWVVTVPYTIHTNKLNIYQISWSMTEGLQLYENNVLLGIEKNPISVSTSHTSTSNIHVGMTSATLLITSIQTWTASRLILSQRGILERTESCHGTPVDSGKLVVDLSFKSMNKNILTSTDMNILVHGGPDVILTHNETSLDLSEPGRYLEIETHCLPCLSDLLQCSSGFTIQLEVILKDILGFKTYIIDSSNLAQGYTSLSLFYEGERIKGNVIVGERKWLFNIPFELKVNSPYLLQLSWSNLSGLHLYIDELCVITLPDALQSLPAVKTPPLFLIGKAATTNDTSAMIISKLKIYLATREKLVKLGILKPPVTTMSTTTLTPPTVPTVPEFIWNFVNIKTDILVSSFLELNVHGQPRGDITGIILQTSKEYLEISNLGMTCLTDIRLCRNGLTLAIELLFNKLEENTVILTTGAETPDLPGISVLYRYGHFHIIFSSTTEAWFVSIPREHISTGVSHTLMISWHQSLKVYVDQMLRGTAKEHVSHPDTGHELKEQLFIGHSFTSLTSVRPVNCVLTTFHIWYKFIDELQKTGAVVIKEEKTTLKPGICSAGCIPTTTTVMPTTPTTTTTPKATTRPTTESTTPKPTTLPDVGVPSFRPLLSLRPVVDQTGTYLACSVGTYSEKNVHIEFMWFINNVAQIAKSVNTPLKEGRLYASEIKGVQDNLLNSVIFCTAKAKFIAGRQWSSTQQSMTFVPHITMLTATREKIVLIEGHQGTTIDLHTNCPPSLFCKVKDKGECKVEIVATLQTNGHDRKCTHEVVLPQLVVHQSVSTPAVCGQVMTSSNWKQAITIPIKATVDSLQDKDQLRNLFIQLKVTGGVDKETLTQKIEEYQVLVKDKDTYRASTCSSLNDPHIATFDGLHYNNFQEGEYVLYRHKTLPYEVRAQYRRCSTRHSRGPTCNCAVAVQSGDDVITISGCHGSSGRRSIFSRFIHHHSPPMTVELYKNGELTPGTTIRRIGCGQTYEIRLPTGTTITVKTSFKSFINVWVRASAVDFQQSLGLCGSFNGNKGDDLYGFDQKTYRYTKQPDEFCKTWHVSEKATIFHGVSAHSVGTDTYCSCVQGKQLYCAPSLDIFRCATTTTSRDDVTATLVRQAKVPGPSLRRSKRAVTFDLEPLAFDQSDETGPVSNYTTTSATQYCQQYLETQTATKTCKQFVDVTQDLLSDCAEDLVQTGDEGWAQSHLDDIITKCVSEAVRTAPFTNTTLAESVPHDVVSKLCTQLCQQGTCQEASCVCDDGYTGITCDVSKVTKPEIVPVSEDGSGCNIKEGCTDVAIMGVNFVESESLKCFYQLVDVTSEMTTLGPWIPSQATYLSTYQVVCSLPPHSARVGVSNDGVQSSDNSYLHVVHDDCHTCAVNEEGTDAQCHKKTDTCVISGACFLSGEKMVGSECRVCEPSVSQDMWTLSSDPLCSATKLSHTGGSEESISTTTILLAVLVALLALIIVVGVVVYCKKRTPVRKKLVEEGEYNFSSPQSRLSSMPRPNMRDISFSNAVYDGRAQSLQPDMREGKPVEMREREPVEMRGRKPVEMMENL